jgi:flavin reductase (DIM6/NTAB) family NADH-FMN oxidoreductase RutF
MKKVNITPNRFLMTTPVVLLSCWGKGGRPNIITLAWTGVLCSDPPIVYASIRPSRHSHSLLKANGDFVINLPGEDLARQVDLCGMISGRDEDKFAAARFTAEPAEKVDAPLVVECPVNLECRTREVLHLGVHDTFIADVVGLLVDDSLVVGADRVDDGSFAPLVYATGPRHYHRTERIDGAHYGFSRSPKPPWEAKK